MPMLRPAAILTFIWLLLGQTLLHAAWTGINRVGSTIYFSQNLERTISRYDLATATWLEQIHLSADYEYMSAAWANEDGIYVAYGESVFLYDHSGANERHVVDAALPVRGIHTDGNLLFLNQSRNNAISLTCHDKTTGAVLGTHQGTGEFFPTKLSPSANLLLGLDGEENGYGVLAYRNDGTFNGSVTPLDYPSAQIPNAWFLGDGSRILNSTGIIRSATAPYPVVGEFGRYTREPESIPDRGIVTIIDKVIASYTEDLTLIEQINFPYRQPTNLFQHEGNLFVFFKTGEPEIIPLDSLFNPTPAPSPDPTTLAYLPDSIFISNDGIVHLFSKTHRSIFRWNPVTQTYLGSIPLLGPSFVAYSPVDHSIFTGYPTGLVRKIDLADPELREERFGYLRDIPDTIVPVGNYLLGVTGGSYELLGPDGKPTYLDWFPAATRFYWNQEAQELYLTHTTNLGPTETHLKAIRIGAGGAASADIPPGTMLRQMRSNSMRVWDQPLTHRSPVMISPDGTTLVLGSGLMVSQSTFQLLPTVIDPFQSGTWNGSRFYSLLETGYTDYTGTTNITAREGPTLSYQAGANVPGTPFGILPLADGKNVVVTNNKGSVSLYVIGQNLGIIPPETFAPPSSLAWSFTTDTKIKLSWRDATGETSYRIERRTLPHGDWLPLGTATFSSYTDNTPVSPADYEYRVISVNGALESAPTAPLHVRFGIPAIPSGLTVVQETETSVRVSWDAVPEATSYMVFYRGYPYGEHNPGGSTPPAGATSIVLQNFEPGSVHAFSIRANNPFGSSAKSGEIVLTTLPPAPTLRVHEVITDEVLLDWSRNQTVTRYRLERRIAGQETWETIYDELIVGIKDPVEPLTHYQYRVISFNAAGSSPYSEIVDVITPEHPAPVLTNWVPSLFGRTMPGPAILLSWYDAQYETSYRIDRRTDTTGWETVAHPAAGFPSFYTLLSWTDPNVVPGTHYTYRVTAINDKGSVEFGTTRIEAADTPVIITDDFEPGLDETMWSQATRTGTTVVEGGASGNHVLRIDGGNTHRINTREVDLSMGGYIRFKFRGTAGSPAPVRVHIPVGNQRYILNLRISPNDAGFTEWNTYEMIINPGFLVPPSHIVIGTETHQPGFPWEIDDLEVTGVVPHSVPEPVTEFSRNEMIGESASIVSVQWLASNGSAYFVIERRTADTPWVVVGEQAYTLDSAYGYLIQFFDTVRASTEYFYRVTAKNPAGLSTPSEEVRIVTLSAWEAWRRKNFEYAPYPELSSPLADNGTGIPNLLRFAFNMDVPGLVTIPTLEDLQFSGMPVTRRDPESGLLRVEFFRRQEATNPETDYIVEFSDDCKNWQPGGRQIEVIPSSYAGMEKVTWEDTPPPNASPAAIRFARVRVTQR